MVNGAVGAGPVPALGKGNHGGLPYGTARASVFVHGRGRMMIRPTGRVHGVHAVHVVHPLHSNPKPPSKSFDGCATCMYSSKFKEIEAEA